MVPVPFTPPAGSPVSSCLDPTHLPPITSSSCILQPGFPTTPRQIVVTATVVVCAFDPQALLDSLAFCKPVFFVPRIVIREPSPCLPADPLIHQTRPQLRTTPNKSPKSFLYCVWVHSVTHVTERSDQHGPSSCRPDPACAGEPGCARGPAQPSPPRIDGRITRSHS